MKQWQILLILIVMLLTVFLLFFRSCTAEGKLCPDGTVVGRSGPFCEFAPCEAAINPISVDVAIPISIIR